MRNGGRRLCQVTLLLSLAALSVQAQDEAFGTLPSMGQDQREYTLRPGSAYLDFRPRGYSDDGTPEFNLRLSNLYIDLGGRSQVTFDDNTNQSSGGSSSGMSLENGLDITLYWPISPVFTLDTSFYLGYIAGLSGDTPEGWVMRANEGSTFSFSVLGDNSVLSLVDTLQMDIETFGMSPLSNTAGMRLLENDLALQYVMDLSDIYSLGLRLGRVDVRSIGAGFRNRDRYSYYLTGELPWMMNPDVILTPYGSVREYTHLQPLSNDAREFLLGLRLGYIYTQYTRMSLSLAYQYIDIDPTNNPPATQDGVGPYIDLRWNSQVSSNFSHALRLAYGMRLGYVRNVNYSKDLEASYAFYWNFRDDWYLRGSIAGLRMETVGFGTQRSDTMSIDIQLGRWIGERSYIYVGCRRTDHFSQYGLTDFERNMLYAGIVFDL